MQGFTTGDGRRLSYADQGGDRGAAPVLLCLAGLTRNMDDFEPVVDFAGARARVIRLDARGRGASEHDPDFHNYNIMREATDVVELLDHLALERVAILGTSRGGLLAMALAVSHRARLSAVMLNDIGPEIEPGGLEAIMGYLGRAPRFGTLAEAAAGLPALMGCDFPGVSNEAWRHYARRLWREGTQGLELRYDPALRDAVEAQAAQSTTPPDLWPMFAALDGLPLALLRGENSNLLSLKTATKMQALRPDMIYSSVADRGHVPFLDEPEAHDVLTRFLDVLDG
jgi:pimeloyl-ACP methyl ester carboxylesterase